LQLALPLPDLGDFLLQLGFAVLGFDQALPLVLQLGGQPVPLRLEGGDSLAGAGELGLLFLQLRSVALLLGERALQRLPVCLDPPDLILDGFQLVP
jgi:hypothetical protein